MDLFLNNASLIRTINDNHEALSNNSFDGKFPSENNMPLQKPKKGMIFEQSHV